MLQEPQPVLEFAPSIFGKFGKNKRRKLLIFALLQVQEKRFLDPKHLAKK